MTMKRAIRNAVIRLTGRCALLPHVPRVLALHEVSDATLFAEQLDRLQTFCEIISLAEALRDRQLKRSAVALTFDDGYASWASIAAPILTERKLPATFFVCSGIPGLRPALAAAFSRERLRRQQSLSLLDTEALHRLAQNPCFELGSHSVSHPDFATLSVEEMEHELCVSKSQLEAATGRMIRYFAFPFGSPRHVPDAALALARTAGYEAVFSYSPAALRASTTGFLFGRSGVEVTDSPDLWKAAVRGGYELPFAMKERANAWIAGAVR